VFPSDEREAPRSRRACQHDIRIPMSVTMSRSPGFPVNTAMNFTTWHFGLSRSEITTFPATNIYTKKLSNRVLRVARWSGFPRFLPAPNDPISIVGSTLNHVVLATLLWFKGKVVRYGSTTDKRNPFSWQTRCYHRGHLPHIVPKKRRSDRDEGSPSGEETRQL